MTEDATTTDPNRWLEDHGDILYRYALGRMRDSALAEDLVQETFLAAIKAKDRFQGRSSERTWLVGILKHKMIDYIRKHKREILSDEMDVLEQPTEDYFDRKGHWKVGPAEWIVHPRKAFEKEEFWQTLHGCISALPERHRLAFSLREIDGEGAEEICKALDITPTNLWVILYRARMQLKKCLEINWLGKTTAATE